MRLGKVISFTVAVVIGVAATEQLPRFTMEVKKAQVRLLRESRAGPWGSPQFLRPSDSSL